MGKPLRRHTSNSLRVCGSKPFAASTSMTALSAALTVRYVSSLKSACPGVSRRFSVKPSYSNDSAVDDIEIPEGRGSIHRSDVGVESKDVRSGVERRRGASGFKPRGARRETNAGRESPQGMKFTTRTRSYGDRREEQNAPLCFSISIQSDVAAFAPRRARTAPASWIAPP
eukprot:30984-Pelagococcus_subviridis.AAC.2